MLRKYSKALSFSTIYKSIYKSNNFLNGEATTSYYPRVPECKADDFWNKYRDCVDE